MLESTVISSTQTVQTPHPGSAGKSTPLMWHCRSNQSAPTPLRTSSGHVGHHTRPSTGVKLAKQLRWKSDRGQHGNRCIWTTPLRICKTLADWTMNFRTDLEKISQINPAKRADCVNTIVHAIPMCEIIATRDVQHGPRRTWAIHCKLRKPLNECFPCPHHPTRSALDLEHGELRGGRCDEAACLLKQGPCLAHANQSTKAKELTEPTPLPHEQGKV